MRIDTWEGTPSAGRRRKIEILWGPLHLIALGAVLVALVLAGGVVAGKVPWDGLSASVLTGLVGASAVVAYAGAKAPGKRRR